MRQIKFRGYNHSGKEWFYGSLIQFDGGSCAINDIMVAPDTVGQFTGLLDKNGKEIYEGDILSANGRVVGWVKGGVRGYCYDVVFVNHPAGEKRWSLYATVMNDYKGKIEITGNIHDNPSLTMKKIMFNDKFGLTEAVLSGRKTQTRRIIKFSPIDAKYVNDEGWSIGGYVASEIINHYSRHKVGEVVAVAQSYKDCGFDPELPLMEANGIGGYVKTKFSPGWNNKMFARANLMPHHVRITNVRVERLQDISDEDCIKEGVREVYVNNNWGNSASHWEFQVPYEDKFGCTKLLRGATPQEAYAALIDKISGKGTWESNPYVFVYDFELVK